MFSGKSTEDRIAILKLNAELRHAQLELLSAQCVTDRLRLSFSTHDVARHGQPDVLRKALQASAVLYQYYSSIQQCSSPVSAGAIDKPEFNARFIAEATTKLRDYLQQQRNWCFPLATALCAEWKSRLEGFFVPATLNSVKTVELKGQRTPPPPFYAEAKALGLHNLPEVTHMPSLTFMDVVVFNDRMEARALFHGLVHAVQFEVLGLERYADLFVRGFLRRSSHFNVPLEKQAIELESKFAAGETFSVEEQVWLWANQGRYEPR